VYIKMAALGSVLTVAIAASPAFAQRSGSPANKTEGKEIKVVGCVQWEKDCPEGAGARTAAASVGTDGNGAGKRLTEGAAYGDFSEAPTVS
jgi:hypothetical protein